MNDELEAGTDTGRNTAGLSERVWSGLESSTPRKGPPSRYCGVRSITLGAIALAEGDWVYLHECPGNPKLTGASGRIIRASAGARDEGGVSVLQLLDGSELVLMEDDRVVLCDVTRCLHNLAWTETPEAQKIMARYEKVIAAEMNRIQVDRALGKLG